MTGDTVGGVWTFTLELAGALEKRGIEVMLATLGGEPTERQRAEAQSVPNLRLATSSYKLEWMDDPWREVEESGVWLLSLARQFTPDVIHLNSYGHGALPWNAPVLVTAHSCVLSWWAAVRRQPLPPSWNRYRKEVERSLTAADLITAPSRAMLRSVEANYGPGLPPRRVVENGRCHSRYRSRPKQELVLAAGRLWDEAKNVAAIAAIARNLTWPVHAAGDARGPNGESIDTGGCRCLGILGAEELADWYARAAIFAAPARYEPFGLSALEAALSGCALVLGDIDSYREIWGDAAVFVSPEDPPALEAALNDLIDNRTKRETMASRAFARAGYFTPGRMAQEYADAYSWLAEARSTACAS
jgi:glycosyltransferase involved in cell wall biosynthesis